MYLPSRLPDPIRAIIDRVARAGRERTQTNYRPIDRCVLHIRGRGVRVFRFIDGKEKTASATSRPRLKFFRNAVIYYMYIAFVSLLIYRHQFITPLHNPRTLITHSLLIFRNS